MAHSRWRSHHRLYLLNVALLLINESNPIEIVQRVDPRLIVPTEQVRMLADRHHLLEGPNGDLLIGCERVPGHGFYLEKVEVVVDLFDLEVDPPIQENAIA